MSWSYLTFKLQSKNTALKQNRGRTFWILGENVTLEKRSIAFYLTSKSKNNCTSKTKTKQKLSQRIWRKDPKALYLTFKSKNNCTSKPKRENKKVTKFFWVLERSIFLTKSKKSSLQKSKPTNKQTNKKRHHRIRRLFCPKIQVACLLCFISLVFNLRLFLVSVRKICLSKLQNKTSWGFFLRLIFLSKISSDLSFSFPLVFKLGPHFLVGVLPLIFK